MRDHLNGMLIYRTSTEMIPNVLIVFYEELVINPERVIGQMEKHIGLTCSQEFIKDVTEATRFESLKKANYEDEMNIRKHFGENFSFY